MKYIYVPISLQCQTFTYRGVQQTPYLEPLQALAARLSRLVQDIGVGARFGGSGVPLEVSTNKGID